MSTSKQIIPGGAFLFISALITLIELSGQEEGFHRSLIDFIEIHAQKAETRVEGKESDVLQDEDSHAIRYQKGDWVKYVVSKQYVPRGEVEEKLVSIDAGDDSNIVSYGSLKMNLIYGKSHFTSGKYKRFDEDKPVSKIIQSGFYPERELQLHIEGSVGKRLKLYVDHDSNKADNRYVMKYTAEEDDEAIREINAGEVDIKMNNSRCVVFDDTSRKGLGIDMTLKKNRLRVKAFGTVSKGEAVVERFRGNSSGKTVELREYQYVRGKYYQIEPFKRYDNLSTKPAGASSYNLITFTSQPPDPKNYAPYAVHVDAASFELYMDDQNPHNNYNAMTLSVDGGRYVRLSRGTDYTINYATGLITFTNPVSENARIFAVYTLNGGSTLSSDPASRLDVFPGKIFVFIKYGSSIDEDTNKNFVLDAGEDRNGDGVLNVDVYEVRSVYSLGDRNIQDDNFRIDFLLEQSQLSRAEIEKAGRYALNPSGGIVAFHLREPFRPLLGSDASKVYRENQGSSAVQQSRYRLRMNYFREARSFQLSNTNIIPGSVRVRVNGREIPQSLYSVDHTSGFFEFINPANPLIGPETDIEIRYEYLPAGGDVQSFLAGVRADYDLGRNIDIGGTVIFSRGAGGGSIPKVGSEPEQLLVFEGDAKLYLSQKKLEDFINSLPGGNIKSVPFEVTAYAEYAKSYKNVNTFGKALIDDMEGGDEVIGISLSERDWILSSPPSALVSDSFPALTQANRGVLRYLYYRSPDSSETLRTPAFAPYTIDYSVKPGPYNVAAGHLASNVMEESHQKSLVLDFDFTGGKRHASVVTRRLSSQAVDFSSLQYLEIWYRSTGGSGTAHIYFDIGTISEDSDGDGVLDTEDVNNNGFLDSDPSADIFEDIGYIFNPAGGTATKVGSGPQLSHFTRGDGTLTSEDLNGNGTLETVERIIRLPGDITTPYSSAAPLSVDMADTTWRRARIYINRSSAAYTANPNLYNDILSRVEAVRLFVVAQTAVSGAIYIDHISFVSSRWQNVKINGVPVEDPDRMSVTIVDTHNDAEYRQDAFIYQAPETYKSLHGERSSKELEREKESAISVRYNLSGGSASVTRKFQTPLDIRFYKTCNLWINFREITAGDTVTVSLGSSESDRIEYEFPAEYPGLWREITLRLQSSSGGSVAPSKTVGHPDMKRIRYVEVSIRGGAGRFWLNDMYVSEPETLSDSAWWLEGEIRGKRPLARTASGVPIISDLTVKYIMKGHGAQFGSVGKTVQDMSEQFYQLFSSATLLPRWTANFDYTAEKSYTDSFNEAVSDGKRGKAGRKSMFVETAFMSDSPLVPSVKLSYKHDRMYNEYDEFVSGFAVNRQTESVHRAPMLWLEEKAKDVLWGNITATIQIATSFREEEIIRKSDELSPQDLAAYKSPREKEHRQKGGVKCGLDYQSGTFYFTPVMELGSQEVVKLEGKNDLTDTKILQNIEGGFHIPFMYDGDLRYVDRTKNLEIKTGFRNIGLFDPALNISMYYLENRFRDYTDEEKNLTQSFTRARDAQSFISTRFDLPLSLSASGVSGILRSFVVGFGRTVYLQETEVPYEGEGISPYDEQYGISRAYGAISGAGFNQIRYNPFRFLRGRGNFAGGRDYVYATMNEAIVFDNGSSAANYGNSLRLVDTISTSGIANFGPADLTLSMGLNNLCERKQILSPPQQVVSLSANAGLTVDVMQIVSFGFFRPNRPGLPHHAASITGGYMFTRNMIITSNIREDVHSPSLGITFKRDRAGLGIKGGIDFRFRKDVEYIPLDDNERSSKDDIYAANMSSTTSFKETDRSYKFSTFFETDVIWLYDVFSSFYELKAKPIFNIEYSLLLNKYEYTVTVSPEPYDQHLVTGKLTLDLHQNIQGGLLGRWALEKFRNRETDGVYREIISYEVGLNFTLLF